MSTTIETRILTLESGISEQQEDQTGTQEAEARAKRLHEDLVNSLVDIRDSALQSEVPEEHSLTKGSELIWRLDKAILQTVELIEDVTGHMVVATPTLEYVEFVGTEITGLSVKFFDRVNS